MFKLNSYILFLTAVMLLLTGCNTRRPRAVYVDGSAVIGSDAATDINMKRHSLTNVWGISFGDGTWQSTAGGPLTVALPYSGTNIFSNFALARAFRITLTNDAWLMPPVNAVDGQILRWWVKQGAGGSHSLLLSTAYFTLPEGVDSLTLSTGAGRQDLLVGEYEAATTNVHFTGLMLFRK